MSSNIARFWPGIFADNIDAAVEKQGIVYFFKGSEYTAWDVAAGKAEPGGAKSIARFWPGIFADNIDAAVEKQGIVYFFKGSEYTAWDVAAGKAEPGGAKSIARFWPGIFADNIDAAVEKQGIVYFFKGSEYTAWDVAAGKAEPGGAKSIARFWPGIFADNIDAAVEKQGIVYFFKGSEYTAWDVAVGKAESSSTFPITGSRHDDVGGGHMQTAFTLDAGGTLNAATRWWTNVKLKGFTGSVNIVLTDSGKMPIWISPPRTHSVDGEWVGDDDRDEAWSETVPSSIISQVHGYAILQEHNPKWLSLVGKRVDQALAWLNSDEGKATIGTIATIAVML
jgi:glutaredoxin-related protein